VVSFIPCLLHPQEKSPQHPLDRRLGGPQSLSGRSGGEKNSQPLSGLEPPIIQLVAQHCTTELSWLRLQKYRSINFLCWSTKHENQTKVCKDTSENALVYPIALSLNSHLIFGIISWLCDQFVPWLRCSVSEMQFYVIQPEIGIETHPTLHFEHSYFVLVSSFCMCLH
jgi:hypothetical protein